MENSYIFSQKQLKVLLKGMGINRVTGLGLDADVMNNADVLQTLNSLVRSELLGVDKDEFVMTQDIKTIVTRLKEATSCYAIRTRMNDLPDLCCYEGKPVLVCDCSTMNQNDICCNLVSAQELFETLDDEGYYPCDEDDYRFDNEELEEYENSIFIDYDETLSLTEDSKILFSIERFASESNVRKSLYIVEYSLFYYILCVNDCSTQRYMFSHKKANELFCQWFSEEKK